MSYDAWGDPPEPKYDPECPTCGGTLDWEDCHSCEDGYSHHDCGEDTCCCLYPDDNVECDVCDGNSGWYRCWNDHDGQRDFSASELPEAR